MRALLLWASLFCVSCSCFKTVSSSFDRTEEVYVTQRLVLATGGTVSLPLERLEAFSAYYGYTELKMEGGGTARIIDSVFYVDCPDVEVLAIDTNRRIVETVVEIVEKREGFFEHVKSIVWLLIVLLLTIGLFLWAVRKR